jgi:hypothetical protein
MLARWDVVGAERRDTCASEPLAPLSRRPVPVTTSTSAAPWTPQDEELQAAIDYGSLSYAVLVRERRAAEEDAGQREAYGRALRAFVGANGAITTTYRWPSLRASLAKTEKPRHRLASKFGAAPLVTLHLITGPLDPEVAELVGPVTVLARRAELLLRSADRKILIDDLVDLLSLLLGNASTNVGGRLADAQRDHLEGRLSLLEEQYEWAARRSAQLTYFFSMLGGLLPLVFVAAITGLLLWAADVSGFRFSTYISTFVAGGLGAIVSVMTRMSSAEFNLAPELGRPWLRLLGMIRPFVGGIFGVLSYFALTSDLLAIRLVRGPQEFYALCVIAFVFGFSERLAPDMLTATQQRLLGRDGTSSSASESRSSQPPLSRDEDSSD